MSESKDSTTTPQHTPTRPEPKLVAQSIEFRGTHEAEIGFRSTAGEITSETAFDAAHRFNVHAALVEALEAVHARRIAWPKEIEEKATAALAAAKGTK